MKVSKFDVGAEVISILTKGMYPDPRDAVREYIQNAIDAGSKDVEVKVRQSSVVIEDNGLGMDYQILRKAIRVGVSDKKPGKDIGFMGIGIYSAFHLCDKLSIFTRRKQQLPQSLEMDFKGMRSILSIQKERRLSGEIKSEDLIDLQSLLEQFIVLPDEGEVLEEEYPIEGSGTRIELEGLNPVLDDLLNDFDDLSNYLEDVVPLHFHNKEMFEWGEQIEKKIEQISKINNAHFELINLKLQVGTKINQLFRPYTNDIFANNKAFEPEFIEIKYNNNFIGLAWGCLNSQRERIKLPIKDTKGRNLRGFLLKKQGFSIGHRDDLSKYFGGSNTHYHRYTGEIIILNEQLLPNASRNDLEASELKKAFLIQLQTKVAPYFISISNKFQEEDKAREVLKEQGNHLKKVLAEYNPYNDNYNIFLEQIQELDNIIAKLKSKKSKFIDNDKKESDKLIESATKLKREVLIKFQELSSKKAKSTKAKSDINVTTEVADNLTKYKASDLVEKYESLILMLESLEIDLNPSLNRLFELIDERFIQGLAKSKTEYYHLLNQLKEDFENE